MNIEAKKLGKRFNREWVFHNLNFSFNAATTYAIIGPNGCGKSTLLQILWGQLPPTVGDLFYSNQKNIPIEEVFNSIAIATPYMELIEEFTLSEMLAFHFKFKKVRHGNSVSDLFDLLELSHAKNKPLYQFSSGMKQRLKLGLAFYSDVNCIFLDEPTTNLDNTSTQWYFNNLMALPQEILVIIASNNEHEYPNSAEKIEILNYK